MEENVLDKLKSALESLSGLLDEQTIKDAIGLIPATLKDPVIDGLKTVLDVITNSLNELKGQLDSIVNLDQFFDTVNNLLEAAEGLAPSEADTLNSVSSIVGTLQDLPGLAEIEEILTLIGSIITKLDSL